jgi:hypothetical protein
MIEQRRRNDTPAEGEIGMSHNDPKRPALTDRAEADRQARLAREAEALRANLRKRKQQAQARRKPAEKDSQAG